MLLVAHRSPRERQRCVELAEAGANVFEADVRLHGERLVVSHFVAFPGLGEWLQHDNWRVRLGRSAADDQPLPDQIELAPHGVQVLLDLKEHSPRRRARLVAALGALPTDRSRLIVSSPNPDDLHALRPAGYRTWLSVGNRFKLRRVLAGELSYVDGVTVRHTLLDAAVIAGLHEAVPVVLAWTVNDPARAKRLTDAGVDGLTSDSLSVFRQLSR
ncbi:MAG TPA: glycerophosphodiester phosphodiesterase [Jatrophihabitantaceae bacterium]|nr:glycerophosphodiester phosphodiesterase [Jatrophihabitantaceae bacterium]